jgi:hypothetical protein
VERELIVFGGGQASALKRGGRLKPEAIRPRVTRLCTLVDNSKGAGNGVPEGTSDPHRGNTQKGDSPGTVAG